MYRHKNKERYPEQFAPMSMAPAIPVTKGNVKQVFAADFQARRVIQRMFITARMDEIAAKNTRRQSN